VTHASPPSYLAIITECHGHRSVLRLRGELDAANQDQLRCAIRSVVDHHSPRVLVLDLSELGFADCSGLSAVLWAHKRLAGQGHELVLKGIQPLVRRLLDVTGLDTYLHVSTGETPLVAQVEACPGHQVRAEESGPAQARE
jgi:anti-anti-sigma factor